MIEIDARKIAMAAVMLNELSDKTYRALERRASEHGQSLEAEISGILDAAVASGTPDKLGSALAALGDSFGGIELKIVRDRTPAPAANFD